MLLLMHARAFELSAADSTQHLSLRTCCVTLPLLLLLLLHGSLRQITRTRVSN
jgi:hypothetical protein